jgi:membrane dipeptidase
LKRPSFRLIADHIDHVVSLSGIDHVGLGSDFDGIAVTPDGLEDVSMLPKLFEELRSRGYSEDDIAKIAGGNFLRVLDEVASL